MHPDALIAGLRRELDRLDKAADDYADRKKRIEAEIAAVDEQPRPEAAPEQPETVIDPNVRYLAGLKRELERVAEDAKAQVRKEIARVESLIHPERSRKPAEKPAAKGEKNDA